MIFYHQRRLRRRRFPILLTKTSDKNEKRITNPNRVSLVSLSVFTKKLNQKI